MPKSGQNSPRNETLQPDLRSFMSATSKYNQGTDSFWKKVLSFIKPFFANTLVSKVDEA